MVHNAQLLHTFFRLIYTGHFIMFSVITDIYNKKTKGPTLMELFTATGKLKKFFFTTRDVRCVYYRWGGTHRYDIQVLATHASTWAHRYSSLLQWSVPLGQQGHMAIVGWIPGLWHIPKEKKSQGVTSGDVGDHSNSCWSFPDPRPIQHTGNTVFRYWWPSQWKWAGLPSCWIMNVGMFCNCG